MYNKTVVTKTKRNKDNAVACIVTAGIICLGWLCLSAVHAENTGLNRRCAEVEEHFERVHGIDVHAEPSSNGNYVLVTIPEGMHIECEGQVLQAGVNIYK